MVLAHFGILEGLCTSQFQLPIPPPPPWAIPGHLTPVNLRTGENLTQNEARLVGHLTFVSKSLSVVGNKRISQFFFIHHVRCVQGSLLLSISHGFFCCCRFI